MVVVFSVNGGLASYSISWEDPEHVTAWLTGNGDKRKDIPDEIQFKKIDGQWTSDSENELIKRSIIHALVQSNTSEASKSA